MRFETTEIFRLLILQSTVCRLINKAQIEKSSQRHNCCLLSDLYVELKGLISNSLSSSNQTLRY